jgi:hypothetical protein
MPLIIGIIFALAVGVFATGVGLDRDRAFYPAITIVIALLYVLFAVMGNSTRAIALDSLVSIAFIVAAVAGFKRSLWIVAAALAGHGIMDLFHSAVIANPGVPTWWPAFCSAYDVVAAGYLAWLIRSGRVRAAT